VRTAAEVLDRALGLHVVVAVAGGLEGDAGRRWLDGLGVAAALTPGETVYLRDAAEGLRVEDAARATQAEGLAALLWALGLLDDLPTDGPASAAPAVLPGAGEPIGDELAGAALRTIDELEGCHDLLAGMAWALRADPDLEVGAAPGSLDPYVVRQRLGALRWVLGEPLAR
jgi:hypothetical protein